LTVQLKSNQILGATPRRHRETCQESSVTAFPSNQDVQVSLPAAAAAGGYNWAEATQHVFTVTAAGSQTIHLLAQGVSANWSASELQLTLIYFATD
jgi:hypothetical protein